MKPTQQEIIELAREAGVDTYPEWLHGIPTVALERLVHLALERFGAGGGEPFGYFCDWGDHDGLQRIAMYYGEPGSATFDDWNEYPKVHKNLPLYTHPSPADLRAEYLRGLEDAAKVARAGYDTFWQRHEPEFPKTKYDQASVLRTMHATVEFVSTDIADAIEALKGKQ